MRRMMLIKVLIVVGAVSASTILLVACGGSSTSSKPAGQAGPAQASESIASYAQRLQAAAASGDCAQLQVFDAVYFAKAVCGGRLVHVANLKVLGAASYGAGGIIDVVGPRIIGANGTKPPQRTTFVVGVDSRGKWTISYSIDLGHAAVGTTASDTTGFLTDLNGTLAALRNKDCAAFIKYSSTATNNPSECTQPFASGVAKALRADPTAVPTSLGGNAEFQFYALNLKGYSGHQRPTYLTWDVAKTSPGPGVIYPYATDPPGAR